MSEFLIWWISIGLGVLTTIILGIFILRELPYGKNFSRIISDERILSS